MSEKIRIGAKVYGLAITGIKSKEKSRKFTIISDEEFSEVEAAFSDVSKIEELSEEDEILITYMDCIRVKQITRNIEDGTYTVEISTDGLERKILDLQKSTDSAICELTILIWGGFGL